MFGCITQIRETFVYSTQGWLSAFSICNVSKLKYVTI